MIGVAKANLIQSVSLLQWHREGEYRNHHITLMLQEHMQNHHLDVRQ